VAESKMRTGVVDDISSEYINKGSAT